MEQRTLIVDLHERVDTEVTIAGSVDVRRDHGKLIFLDIRDRSGKVQAVALPLHGDAHKVAHELRPEWVIELTGKVHKRPEKMVNADEYNGDIELEAIVFKILSKAHELPFELGTDVNLDTYLDYMPLTLRSENVRAVFKAQETIIDAFRTSLKKEGFTEFQAPAIVGGDAEGGAEAFQVDYFNDHLAYLATSPQFYKQIMVGVYERVFTTPKVFRGEKHATPRHLNEYSSLDFEMGFINDHRDVMAVLEKTVRYIVHIFLEEHGALLEHFKTSAPLIASEPFPVLKLREAQRILGASEEPDLEPEQERALCEWAAQERRSDFVFVTHYPVSKRPFYSCEDEADPGFTKSFDLLFRGLEITTGGQRIHDYDTLVTKLLERKLDPEKFSYYLQAFKYGMPPHGGSATGLERLTSRLLRIPNVKRATLFPRDMHRIDTRLSSMREGEASE